MIAQSTREFNSQIRQRKARTLAELMCTMKLDWLARKNYSIVNTLDAFEEALVHIKVAQILGIDTETTGLNICDLSMDNPIKDKMVGMSISWERDQGIYIPFEHVLFNNLDKAYVLKRLMPYLETKSFVTHNGLFDGKVFYDEGIRLNITQDTMLMYFNLDSTVSKGSKGLKALTTRKYGYEVIELSDIFESESDAGLFQYVEYELTKAYACADSDHTLMLFMDSFQDLLPGQIRSYALDIRVQNELIRSEYFGKGIDMKLLEQLNAVNTLDMKRIEELIYTYVGGTLAAKHGMTDHKNPQYRFNISSTQDLGYVMFELLGYEVPVELQGSEKLSIDKFTLKALMNVETTDKDEIFEQQVTEDWMSSITDYDFVWATKKDNVLIEQKEMRYKKYKIACLVTKYRKLEKLRSSFFTPLLVNNFEGKLFSGIKMTRAETARLVDFIQTMDKYLKKLIIPLDGATKTRYIVDFDFAQIEYRVMAGEAKVTSVCEKLQNSEADYHREGGSLVIGKAPEDITGEERSSLKSVNFGIPYGMSAFGILNNRYGLGLDPDERKLRLAEIKEMLNNWDIGLHSIKEMLNRYRTSAITPVENATLPPHLKGKKMGRISNALGRTRLFNLSDLSKQKIASIQRQAGNYPIQSYAREVFCEAFCDFCDACKVESLMDIRVPDPQRATGFKFMCKVDIMAYIHDECLMSVDADVNHEFLYKLIYENCMKKIEGYPQFYCGINVIDNWYEGKDDKFEAPVGYVEEVIAKNPVKFVDPAVDHKHVALAGITEYMIRRITKELISIDPRTSQGYFDMSYLVPRFKNYFVKPKVAVYIGLHRKPEKTQMFDDFSVASLESYALYMFKSSVIKNLDGSIVKLSRESDTYTPKVDTALYLVPKDSDEFEEWNDYVAPSSISDKEKEEVHEYYIPEQVIDMFDKEFNAPEQVTWAFRE